MLFSTAWQSSDITLDKTDKRAGPCNYNTPHTGEKRNKWLHGFVMMISLSAWGNYVTMATYFPWVKVQNNEVGSRGCMLGMAMYCTEIKQRRNKYLPSNPLAALFTNIERRWLVSQGNRKSRINTHLQHKADTVGFYLWSVLMQTQWKTNPAWVLLLMRTRIIWSSEWSDISC